MFIYSSWKKRALLKMCIYWQKMKTSKQRKCFLIHYVVNLCKKVAMCLVLRGEDVTMVTVM